MCIEHVGRVGSSVYLCILCNKYDFNNGLAGGLYTSGKMVYRVSVDDAVE